MDLPKHVGIDGMNLAMPRGTGVATYARNLSTCLSRLGAEVDVIYGLGIPGRLSPLMQEVLFFDTLSSDPPKLSFAKTAQQFLLERFRTPIGYSAVDVPISGRVVADGFKSRLPVFDRIVNVKDLFQIARRHFFRYRRFLEIRLSDPPEIMHWTFPLPIRLAGAKNVYTIHDLVPLRLPYTTLDNKRYFYRLIRRCLMDSEHICTVSEQSKRDLENLFVVPKGKITNTYQTVVIPEDILKKTDAQVAAEVFNTFNLNFGGYFLFFGSIEPKKNIGRMIEAFLYANTNSPLIIVGARAWKSKQELALLESEEKPSKGVTNERIRRIEYAPFSLLVSLIRGAKAVLFPSLYEGFGLPVLEAMMLGTPVLTSNTSSLPEVAGDAAVMVDPYDVAKISEGIHRLDSDEVFREELAARGRVQALLFNADRYQERLAAMYSKL